MLRARFAFRIHFLPQERTKLNIEEPSYQTTYGPADTLSVMKYLGVAKSCCSLRTKDEDA